MCIRDRYGTLQSGIVKGVQGLAQFEHHVVGDVDQCRNRANSAPFEAPPHPGGSHGARVDAGDDPTAIAWASVRGVEHDRSGSRDGDLDVVDFREAGRRAGQRRDFAGQTFERQAVSPVRRQLERQQAVIEVEMSTDIVADHRVGGKDQQTSSVVGNS